ncbi:hypothetical protein BR93DRAFT_984831 [Coniochaeta sp. PMI_546]|nr:hypothetical protein BR93DRAFT_984831 [Coniochaeta sp. PMI_546]
MPLKRHPKYCWAGSRNGCACSDDIFELRAAAGESTSTFGQDFTPSTGTTHSESSTFDFHRVLFSQEGVQNVRRSRKSTIWWAPEILWLFFGYLCFIARFAFTVPIVEGFGQLKWTHYVNRGPRPLADFEALDQASRGPWGSFVILVKYKSLLATLGAAITISGLLTSTVTQQAIEFPLRRAPSDNGSASVGVARTFSMWNGSDLHLANDETTQLKQAIFNGAFVVPRSTLPSIAPTCSSADCEWPLYGSLGICSDVVNLTARANDTLLAQLRGLTADRFSILLNSTMSLIDQVQHTPNALLAVGTIFPLAILGLPAPTGMLDDSLVGLLANDHFIAYSDCPFDATKPPPPNSLDCFKFLEIAFYWCAKSYATKVKDGVHVTNVVSSAARIVQAAPLGLNFAWSPTWYDCYRKDECNSTIGGWTTRIAGAPGLTLGDEVYDIDIWTATASSALMGASLYDSILVDQQRGVVSSSGGGTAAAFASALFGEFLAARVPEPALQFEAVQNITTNMATSLTNFMRRLTYVGTTAPAAANGITFTLQTYARVRWGWTTLLAAQLFLTSLFLVAIVIETRLARVQILKGSTLATMCALDGTARDSIGGISDFKVLNDAAQKLGVKLERGSAGTAIWLAPACRSNQAHLEDC